MRITCPNCGVKYDVGEGVIPPDGRDVQCSNCGHTWLVDPGEPNAPATPSRANSGRRRIDPAVVNVLREEAEREARARRNETAEFGQSESELAPDALRNQPAVRNGVESGPVAGPPPAPDGPAGRIREYVGGIDSSASEEKDDGDAMAASDTRARDEQTGFWIGFVLVAVIAAAAVALYVLKAEVVARVPESKVHVDSYVEAVDHLRREIDDWVAWAGRAIGYFNPQ